MKFLTRARLTLSLAALAGSTGALLASPLLAQGATLKVCASGCAYAQVSDAVLAAQAGDWIRIFPGTYDGGFQIAQDVTLSGAGPTKTIITGGSPVVAIYSSAKVRIRALAITGGSSSSYGGGISNQGTLTLEHVALTHNVALAGGGIYNYGTLAVTKSVLADNLACYGGGLVTESGAPATLDHARVNDNHAVFGGGLVNLGGALTVRESVLKANAALSFTGLSSEVSAAAPDVADELFGSSGSCSTDTTSGGGMGAGLFNAGGGTSILEDDTIVKNGTAIEGGGVFNDSGSSLILRDSTVKLNAASGGPGSGGGVLNGGSLTSFDSSIRHNTADDCVDSGGGTGC